MYGNASQPIGTLQAFRPQVLCGMLRPASQASSLDTLNVDLPRLTCFSRVTASNMSIEFDCPSCTSLLRVPDGTEGQACECPTCGNVMDIPQPGQVKKAETVAAAPAMLPIPCPRCNKVLLCAPELLGTQGQCRGCKFVFTISEAPTAQTTGSGLFFNCPACDQLFSGQEEMQDRKGKCHVCGEVFQIQLNPPTPEPDEQRREAAEVVADPDDIQIVCGGCEGVMEVPSSAAGCTTQCPFCQAMLQIPL